MMMTMNSAYNSSKKISARFARRLFVTIFKFFPPPLLAFIILTAYSQFG